jgi:hypothetical protein
VEKYGRAGQATDNNVKWYMDFACWLTKATDKRSEYIALIAVHGNNGYGNASHCYVVREMPILLKLVFYVHENMFGFKYKTATFLRIMARLRVDGTL